MSNGGEQNKFLNFVLVGLVFLALIAGYVVFGGKETPVYKALMSRFVINNEVSTTNVGDFNLELEVRPLDTKYFGTSLKPVYAPKVGVKVNEKFTDELGAFGVAEFIVFGPKDWTGYGVGLENGQKEGYLYPVGGTGINGDRIKVTGTPSCVECVYDLAATYFPNARIWLKDHNYPVNVLNESTIVEQRSSKLVVYHSLTPNSDGSNTTGFAYFDENIRGTDPAVPYYMGMEIVMSEKKQDLADLLINLMIKSKDFR